MDFQPLIDWCRSYYAQYPIFCYVLAGVILLLLLWKPTKVLKTLVLILVLVVILYICATLVGSIQGGSSLTDKAVRRTEKGIE